MKRLKIAVASTLAALLLSTAVFAAGLFPGFPIVGQGSYCNGFATGTTGQVCIQTVPAGPSALTGLELVPADTQLAQGQQPQTVLIPMAQLGALPTQYATPLTGATVTTTNLTGTLLLDPAGTIAALTVVLPASTTLVDGQIMRISSSQTVTALTITPGTGTTVSNSPTAITISTTAPYGYEFIYKASNTKWYRLQ